MAAGVASGGSGRGRGDELHGGGPAGGDGRGWRGHLRLRRHDPAGLSFSIESDTRLDGSGRQVTISGDGQTGVFIVHTNVTFTVVRLTIAEGSVVWGRGAAIFNNGGTVDASYCSFWGNTAFAPAPLPTTASMPCTAGRFIMGLAR